MRASVILPIAVLCLCGGLLTVARPAAAPVETVDRPLTGMELLRQYRCHRAETKVVLVRGKEDNFSPEGVEPLFFRPGRDNARVESMMRGGSYDQSQTDRSFTDSFQVPAGMAKGLLVLSLKPTGPNGNDPIYIGDLEGSISRRSYNSAISRLAKEWTIEGTLYSAELGRLPLGGQGPRTVQDVFGHRARPAWLDVYLQDDTSVDFMGLAVCVAPTEEKGLTMAVKPAANMPARNVVSLSCNDGPDNAPICDRIQGDTVCREAHPVACLRPGSAPTPSSDVVRYWERWTWTGGDIALTEPVPGERFATIADVDRFCAQRVGEGWRAASMHDGGRAVGIAGWGTAPKTAVRAWIDIVDQPYATCWTR